VVPDDEGAAALASEAARRSVIVERVVADLADPDVRAGLLRPLQPWALVNNAGYMNAGRIQDVPLDDARRQLELMVVAPVDLTRQALLGMIDRGQGRIVNVTSSAVHTSSPLTGWYAAAKAALRELNDALRLELNDTGVDVIDVEPGGYRTRIWDRAKVELQDRQLRSDRPELYHRALKHMDEARRWMGDPEDVGAAVAGVLTVGQPPRHVRIGPGARVLRTLDAVLPDRLWDRGAGLPARAT
jgi:short-subunit dehydrogenase